MINTTRCRLKCLNMIKCNLGSKDNSRCFYSGENTVTCPFKEACWTPICSHNSYYNPARLPSNVPDKRAPTVGKHRDCRLPVQHDKDLHRSNAKVASLQLRRCRVDLAECWSLLALWRSFLRVVTHGGCGVDAGEWEFVV